MNIKYSEKSLKDLKQFDKPDQILIVKKIHYLAENFDALKASKKVTELKGTTFENQYRFIAARKIRVIFWALNDEIILLVLRIGMRKDIYS